MTDNGYHNFKMRTVRAEKRIDKGTISAWTAKDPMFAAMLDVFLTKERGTFIPYSIVETAAGVPRDDKEYERRMPRVKLAVLWSTGIRVVSRPGQGYTMSTVSEQLTTQTDRTLAQAQKKVKQQALSVALIREGDLAGVHERRLQYHLKEECDRAAGAIQTRREVIERSIQAPETLPRLATES